MPASLNHFQVGAAPRVSSFQQPYRYVIRDMSLGHSCLGDAMKTAGWLRWPLLAALLLLSIAAWAQPVWDARRLVSERGSSGTTSLRADGKDVATVDNARVARLVEIVDKIGPQFSLRPEVVIIPGKAPNAFATRNKQGQAVVGFNPAMLDVTGDDADMAAVVVGHELAHLELKHVDESKSREAAVNIIALIAGAAVGYKATQRGRDGTPYIELAGIGALLVNRKFDRDQERAADQLGMKAMHASGYDVHAVPRMWMAMSRVTQGGSGWWASTHPSHSERIETLTQLAVAMRPTGTSPTTTMVASALTRPNAAVAPSTEGRADTYALSGDDGWCLVWGQSADCRFKDLDTCKARGTDCRERTAFTQKLPQSSAASATSVVPVTLQPVICQLPDGTTETLPRVQCASRGGSPQ